MINGLVYDYESIKVLLPTGLIVLLESISYNDKKNDEVVTGVSNLPVGIGRGEYSGECELEIGRFEYEKINMASAASGGFYNIPFLEIIVSYGWAGQMICTDALSVHFTERDFSGKKGDTNLNVKIKGALVAPIVSNGVPSYVPF
jgi:hypothetical protein